ncbi:MAG TPA: long-chain fatty acid--CoA ligase [Trueperaceae bacterium]|nr:long-chain fatty acid--CoA ligase [Trueperaceae bacterium]
MATGLPASVPELLRARATDTGLAQRVKRFGLWQRITWSEYVADVNAMAAEYVALGLEPGDRVAILSENRPEWTVADMATQTAGGATVGVYTTSSPEQLRYYLQHSDAVGLVLEDAEQLEKWLAVRDECPAVRFVLLVEDREASDPAVTPYSTALESGRRRYLSDPRPVDERLAAISPEDVALFIYTSGTTGDPKAAMLSHANIIWATEALRRALDCGPGDEFLSFLPVSHIVERLISIANPIRWGYAVSFTENLDTVLNDLREIRPTIFFAVPRIWEKLYSLVELHMKDAQFLKRVAYQRAMAAVRHARSPAGSSAGALTLALANLAVLAPLRNRLGLDRVRLAISGAAPISAEILAYFRSIGVDVREGFGLTESTGLICLCPKQVRLGTVGTPFWGVDVDIAEDGEILSRSPGNFLGYHKDPQSTAETLKDGWLHTGDIGELDELGHLKITDRKKDILITAGGKNIAPQKIENQLKSSVYINDAVVLGDKRRYLVALLVLDEDNVRHWAADRQLSYSTYTDLTQNPAVVSLIDAEVERVNCALARVETVKRFAILPKRLYHEDGEVTATLKVKRSSIAERYGDLVESLYA